MTAWDAWNYRESVGRGPGSRDLVGYHVHATDGDIGKVDEASNEAGNSRLVVDTGPWIFGRKVVLPAGTVQRVDDDDQKVYVDLTKDQIKDSPEWDQSSAGMDDADRGRLDTYYGGYYR
ncbi:PRC-barrel domain containing protein [Microbacterium sp. NPDC019599]|uniref:PRC-barrel domain containing protein n=1 Tax=Microbacterium sp. NPDC019599 TaxID=3154690 RepID=UPI0033FE0DC7